LLDIAVVLAFSADLFRFTEQFSQQGNGLPALAWWIRSIPLYSVAVVYQDLAELTLRNRKSFAFRLIRKE